MFQERRRTVTKVDLSKPPKEQPTPVFNRWHPDIPMIDTVKLGEVFRVECLDWTGGQVKDNDSAEDIKNVDLTQVHYLSGPLRVAEAEPGDVLVVHLLDLGPLPGAEWGFSGIFDRSNGGGFLTEHYPEAAKAIWYFEGIYAHSRHIPHVRVPSIIHPGLIGCLPSKELLEVWNERELKLVESDVRLNKVPPLATLPNPEGAVLGLLESDNHKEKREAVARTGARTVPPRENGGNCDIKNLSKGSIVFLPVFVKGAGLAIGDIHFAQGDGEINFCGAIEMAGWVEMKVELIKGGVAKLGMKNPIFKPGPIEPRFGGSDYLVFQGISVDESGKQHYLDATIAYRQAILNAVSYLKKLGYTGEQAYMLLGTVPVEGRLSGVVDIPNACCTVAIPTQVFDIDVSPAHVAANHPSTLSSRL
eukprot:TRINITY_DN13066_c0_g1_i1.p1 TRINITY_DN13066_c0_g1~~TRINITY_DN13066_c0_g1_i1.p1  ORF type:complete len:417 (+),score=78.90 TRINITY_DN13066_c0_g1_i1:99-1349(+)